MLERHYENKEQQMNKKIHGLAHFQHENALYQKSGSLPKEHTLNINPVTHSSIQLLAYQLYHEKGGNALDNWLQAEHILNDKKQ